MATPALNNLRCHFSGARFVLVGSPAVADLFRQDPAFDVVLCDDSKTGSFLMARIWALSRLVRKSYKPFDLAVAFPNSFSSGLLLSFSGARERVGLSQTLRNALLTHPVQVDCHLHQAVTYNQIINSYLGTDYETGPTTLYIQQRQMYPRKSVGINPGAAYGSAKRWRPERFAEVARAFSDLYDVIIFGSSREVDIAEEIEQRLQDRGIPCRNMAGRTTISELTTMIAGLDLFITNDSGPMHIAGALSIPSVAIFGPTNPTQTCQWKHDRARIVRHEVFCAPCMKRRCPFKHHACMEEIDAEEVINAAYSLVA